MRFDVLRLRFCGSSNRFFTIRLFERFLDSWFFGQSRTWLMQILAQHGGIIVVAVAPLHLLEQLIARRSSNCARAVRLSSEFLRADRGIAFLQLFSKTRGQFGPYPSGR